MTSLCMLYFSLIKNHLKSIDIFLVRQNSHFDHSIKTSVQLSPIATLSYVSILSGRLHVCNLVDFQQKKSISKQRNVLTNRATEITPSVADDKILKKVGRT